VLALLAAVFAASQAPSTPAPPTPAPATPAPAPSAPATMLEASMAWWERITVTVDDKGKQRACKYQSSLSANGAETCDEETAASVSNGGTKRQAGLFSKLTFERRFSPGPKLDSGRLQTGDTLLGQQVMFLTIDQEGKIEFCRVVGSSGDVLPAYGCEEVKSEKFRVEASAASGVSRQAFMTILVYGHTEQLA
jgi:hypothetical protein